MKNGFDPHTLAQEMKAAQDQCRQIEPFTSRLRNFGTAEAYAVADTIHEMRLKEGATQVGRKIGFTNPEMWSIYGVREPIWAHLYDTTVVRLTGPHVQCSIEKFVEPKIEPEIVVHFHATPPESMEPAEILGSIDWIAHGIEIVQSHFPGWNFQAADTIADSGLHAMLIVGEPLEVSRLGPAAISDLETFMITLSCDGNLRERGQGSNVLGSPLRAVAYLIDVIAKEPEASPLKSGELVTTGTLTPALPIHAGQNWTTKLNGIALPGISVSFEA